MNKRTLFLDITTKCNLACKHCYNKRYLQFKKDSFDFEEFVRKMKNYQLSRIHILGGEPLVSKNLFKVIEWAREKKIKISINTNGIFLSEDMIGKLSYYDNIDQITVSIDGGNAIDNDYIRGAGTFNKVISNLKLNKSKKFNVNIATVITAENLNNIEKLADLNFPYSVMMISIMFVQGGAANNFKKQINGDLFFDKICLMSKKLQDQDKILQLDLKPLPFLWFNILAERSIEQHIKPVDCITNKLYYSAVNRVYICNPSSFIGEKYEIKNSTIPRVKKSLCKQNCYFNDKCLICEINCDKEQFDVCDYVLNKIDEIFKDISNKQIIKSNDYSIIEYKSLIIYINFVTSVKYVLCTSKCGDLYNIENIYRQCDEKEKQRYKTIVAGLYKSGKVKIMTKR